MLELRLKPTILSFIENCSQNIYSHSLKKPVQRIVKSSYTTYFSSFSSFKILHRLIKSFVIPILNRVFGSSKRHFLKSNLKNLKNLNSSKNLKIDRLQTEQTIIHTRKLQSVPKDKITLRSGEVSPPQKV